MKCCYQDSHSCKKMKMTITKGSCCLLLLQCLLLAAVQGCVFNEDSDQAHPDDKRDCCSETANPKFYFTKTKICCNGTVHNRKGKQCCNGELYVPTKSICCGNTVHEKENKICCGSQLFRSDSPSVVCCGGKLHDNHQSCCGGQELYDESSQICCGYNSSFSIADNRNRDCCLDKAYDTEHHRCVNGQILGFKENLCGINKYNTSAKTCCDQILYDMPQFPLMFYCCGSQLYDVSKSTCCLGTKKVIPVNLQCCGEGPFNESTQLCCNNVIQSKEDGSRCCGSETIDATEGCCGAKVYHLSTQKCCKDTNIIPQHQTCCGYKGYDNNTQTCCKNKTIVDIKINDCETDVNTLKPLRNRGSSGSTTGICSTCLWNSRCIYKKIKAGNQSVCQTYTYQIRINKTIRSGIFWTMHGKLMKGNKDARTIRLIVPCKSEKLNKTGYYLLLTDGIIDGKTLRLGDSDLLIQKLPKLEGLIKKKRRNCRKVYVVLSEIQKAVRRLIRKFLGPK